MYTFCHSVTFSNHFILIRVMMNLLGFNPEYLSAGMPVHDSTPCTQFSHAHTQLGAFSYLS